MSPTPTPGAARATRGNVVRAAAGNFLEMYDFAVYGFYAAAIARAVFPAENEFLSLMLSFVTFGVGFLMRPLGAVVLGAYMDRHGRRAGLILSLVIMSVGVVILAVVPGYDTIGIAAPILVVLARLLQGFSAGAESSGVSVYLAEIARPGRRGFYVSWQSASQQISVVVAAVIGVVLALSLSPEQIDAWGWRVPFLIGSLIVPFVFWIRRTLPETESFEQRTAGGAPTFRTVYRTLTSAWPIVLTAISLVTLTSVMFYLITAYTPTFGERELGLTYLASFGVTVVVGLSNFVVIPLAGHLSDRIGRLPLLLGASGTILVVAYPAMLWLTADPSFGRLLAVLVLFSLLYGTYQGAMVVSLTEIMPAAVRASGFAIAYSLAQAVFGGFTPAISTGLIEVTGGNAAMPGAWLAFSAVISLAGALVVHRRGMLRADPAGSGGADAGRRVAPPSRPR
ncbi:tricarballylate/proton symporter TcuC [Pseudonocardia sp. HH130630-07]|uniref:tricarballylate/proton symporter TcuC n=1 Tax=Pseudonocardia sp. HH130630-07 TaxID=1690815 RepID=UPI000814B5C2|nr:tricarballylate/proton symporter TcuC [Pseudonocardia sp. HH130630-07]ANY08333.1 citrate-proton symporter [Pseudonocardia sp. HH130630-07]